MKLDASTGTGENDTPAEGHAERDDFRLGAEAMRYAILDLLPGGFTAAFMDRLRHSIESIAIPAKGPSGEPAPVEASSPGPEEGA